MSASSHRLSVSTRSLSLRSKVLGTIITISLSGIGASSKFIVRTRRATGRSTTVELTKPKIALRSGARQRIRKKRGINRRSHGFHPTEEVLAWTAACIHDCLKTEDNDFLPESPRCGKLQRILVQIRPAAPCREEIQVHKFYGTLQRSGEADATQKALCQEPTDQGPGCRSKG